MKILILIKTSSKYLGGHAVTASTIANTLNKKGHSVFVAIKKSNTAIKLFNKGISLQNVNLKYKLLGFIPTVIKLAYITKLKKIEGIIAMDKAAAFYAAVPSIFFNFVI